MAKYNGHDSYNAWDVSLWINNDEGLYNEARRWIRRSANREEAAEDFLESLNYMGVTHTPDGVKYTKTNIRKAMAGHGIQAQDG
jgi:hypothetical protein